jgi:two-component system, NarL family, sensor kinase
LPTIRSILEREPVGLRGRGRSVVDSRTGWFPPWTLPKAPFAILVNLVLMPILAACFRGAGTDDYGDWVVVTSDAELDRVRRLHQLRSYRIASVLRMGVVGLMVAAMIIGTRRSEWPQQSALIVLYAFVALCAAALAFSPFQRWLGMDRLAGIGRLEPFAFTVIDVVTLTVFQLLSTNGIYPLLIMTMLPILLGLDVSSRRAAVVLVFSMVGFAIAVFEDPAMLRSIGLLEAVFRFVLYGFLCGTAFVVVRIEERHTRSVAGLSALREELLAQTMTASDVLQRRISESIHDGPLQDILTVRQELVELDAAFPGDERVRRALGGLQSASAHLRQATFELHPAILEQVGLGAAVEQLAALAAQRSGIKISTNINYPIRSVIDPIMFGVVRELVSNMVQHSHARSASVALGITDETCILDVVDDGVGISSETVARRLGEGHIGLASHRARVDAAGGVFLFLDAAAGTHVSVELPLKG